MAITDYYRATARFSNAFADGYMVTTLDYYMLQEDAIISENAICAELAELIADSLETDYLSLINDEIVFVDVQVFNITQPQYSGSHTVNEPGTETTTEALAMRNAPVVKKLSGLRGRSYNGRNYWMAPPELYQNQGVITTAYRASLVAMMDNLKTLQDTGADRTYVLSVYSDKLATGVAVQSHVANATMGTLRGRQKVFV